MGRADHVRHFQKRVVEGRRLLFEYVESCPANLALVQRVDKGLLVNHRAPAHVHKIRRFLHRPELLSADHVTSFLVERHDDGEIVGHRAQFVQIENLLGPVLLDDPRRCVRIEHDCFHAPSAHLASNEAGDISESDQTEHLAVERIGIEYHTVPLAGPDMLRRLDHVPV